MRRRAALILSLGCGEENEDSTKKRRADEYIELYFCFSALDATVVEFSLVRREIRDVGLCPGAN